MKTFAHLSLPLLAPCSLFLMWACATTNGTVAVTSAPLRCDEPSLAISTDTPSRQQRGKITILAAADLPKCVTGTHVTYTPWVGIGASMAKSITDRNFSLTRTEKPQYMLRTVDKFAMILSVTNGSDRIFRPEGAVWAVTVDGSNVPTESKTGLSEFIVLPGQTRELRIPAISLKREWQGGVYAFQFFDVPTARDEAGNITQRKNFEWYYTLEYKTLEVPPAATKATKKCNITVNRKINEYFLVDGQKDPYTPCP